MKRIDSILANSGICSRSEARRMIASGRVLADGRKVVSASEKVDESSVITLDGKDINTEKYIYLMMNKPSGYVCSSEGEDSVLRLVPDGLYRKGLFTVGRLDKDTEGLLLITNDGEFGHSVASPKKEITKVYFASLEREVTDEDISAFASGLISGNGDTFLPARLEKAEGRTAYVTVSEGKYHEVKRLFLITGNRVLRLKRVRTGGLSLDPALEPGGTREITSEEKALIFEGKQ